MPLPTITDPWGSAASLLARVLLGGYMAVAGYAKVFNTGVGAFVRGSYAERMPAWLPGFVATPYGYALPFLELATGVLLVVGLFTRITSLVMAALLLSIVVAVGPGFLKGPPMHHAVVMTGMALLIAAVVGGSFSADALLKRK